MSAFFASAESFWIEFVLFFVVYNGLLAVIEFPFLCRFMNVSTTKKRYFVSYVIMTYVLSAFIFVLKIDGLKYRIVYFTVIVIFCYTLLYLHIGKRPRLATPLTVGMLVITVLTLSEGITAPITYLMINHSLPLNNTLFFVLTNIMLNCFTFSFIYGGFYLINKWFWFKTVANHKYLFVLFAPLTLLILSAQITFDIGYGNTMVIEDNKAVSIFNHYETLFIFCFAFACLFCILFTFKKLTLMIEQDIYTKELRQRYDLTRSFRHDFNNHMIVLSQLIKNNKLKEATAYLDKFETAAEQLTYSGDTGNTAIDALFADKLTSAKQKDITVLLDADIPKELAMDDFDLCTIFSNALDNAINACELMQDTSKWIDIKAKRKHDFLLIDIMNSYDNNQPQKKGSGIGLKNMKSTCEKYGGTLQLEQQNDVYICTILLPLQPGQI